MKDLLTAGVSFFYASNMPVGGLLQISCLTPHNDAIYGLLRGNVGILAREKLFPVLWKKIPCTPDCWLAVWYVHGFAGLLSAG